MWMGIAAGVFASAVAYASEPVVCVPPKYFVAVEGTSREGDLKDVPGFQYINIAPNDFTVANLRCLANTLRHDPIAEPGLWLYVFDARWAAADFDAGDVMTMTRSILQSFRLLRARITINDKEERDEIVLTPLGHLNV